MNILLSSAGRRNYLVRYFKDALQGHGRVLAADASGDAPALHEADVPLVVPPFSDESYVPTVIGICRKHDIELVLPLNDFELPVMARAAERLLREARARVIVSTPAVIDTCLDKLATQKFLQQQGIFVPKTYSNLASASAALAQGELSFPVIIKPRWGSGSAGLFCADTPSELETAVNWCRRAIRASSVLAYTAGQDGDNEVLIQEKLFGAEYAFDVVNDLSGRYACTLSRLKLTAWGGEADRAVTVRNPNVEELGRHIGAALGHVRVLDCDAIQTDRGWAILDLNPRFGGAYPFSHAAGADIPAAILAWARHEQPAASCFRYTPGIVTTKTLAIVTSAIPQQQYAFDPVKACGLVEA